MGYAYPSDLARAVTGCWPEVDALLEEVCAACYAASMQRDEGRPITCRVALAEPDDFPRRGGPPDGLHRLVFGSARAFNARELRRLSAAADSARCLIGVRPDGDGDLVIWGLVYQGARWLHGVIGGRGGGPALPPVPVVHAISAGSIEVRRGDELVRRLSGGEILGARSDVFDSQWLHDAFQALQDDLNEAHSQAREDAARRGEDWAVPVPELARLIGEQMMRRVISIARWQQRHGGMIVFLPSGTELDYLDIKYPFADAPARERFFDLLLATLNCAGALHGRAGRSVITWNDFQSTSSKLLAELDEGLFGLATLLANLTAVDGAVVLDGHLNLIGFGAEISGGLTTVTTVHRAQDPEGSSVTPEDAASEGTRHRSAYRLAAAVPDALAIVISQDGAVRFVRSHGGNPTYWQHE